METLAVRYRNGGVPDITRRALNQCLRELLLAQGSDWPFIINNGTAVEYAIRRVKDHVARFHYLAASIRNNSISKEYLSALEELDTIFPDADYRLYG
jgi:1,4-alpha-glucan branching enzyme